MDMFVFHSLCISLLIGLIQAGGPAIANFENKDEPIQAAVGANNLEIKWYSDPSGNPSFTKIKVEHMHAASQVKRLIGRVTNKIPEAVMTGYRLNATDGDTTTFTLTIDSVRPEDDGTFIVTASSDELKVDETVTRNLTVIQKLSKLSLKVGDMEAISAKPADPLQMEAGTYTVVCIAEGSNPATKDVQLSMNGEKVAVAGEVKVEKMAGDTTQFKSTIHGNVTYPAKEATVELQCQAVDPSGESLSTKVDVRVQVPEVKDVECMETEAQEGDAKVSLECVVDRSLLPSNLTRLAFQVGKTGELIGPNGPVGPSDQNATTTTDAKVTMTEMSSTKAKVTLTLAKAEGWHFDTDFYLIIYLADGTERKETIQLKKPGGNTGSRPSGVLGWVVLALMAALWARC